MLRMPHASTRNSCHNNKTKDWQAVRTCIPLIAVSSSIDLGEGFGLSGHQRYVDTEVAGVIRFIQTQIIRNSQFITPAISAVLVLLISYLKLPIRPGRE